MRCTAFDFSVREDGSSPAFRATEITGPAGVEDFLSGLTGAPRAVVGGEGPDEVNFLIVENLCSETAVKLGLSLRISPRFWSEYVENRPWFWKRHVTFQRPMLNPSRPRRASPRLSESCPGHSDGDWTMGVVRRTLSRPRLRRCYSWSRTAGRAASKASQGFCGRGQGTKIQWRRSPLSGRLSWFG